MQNSHLCIKGWRPHGKNVFRHSSNFWSGCGHRSGLMMRIIRAAGLNGSPLIGSQPLLSRLMRMHRYGLSRSSGLDRLPLHRARSHQFKNLFRQLMYVLSQAIAEEAWRNVSPRLITAQAIRASLFATATVTTRAGRLSSNALSGISHVFRKECRFAIGILDGIRCHLAGEI